MDDLIYHVSDGRPSDITALETKKTYIEFLSICNNHIKRVNKMIAEAEALKNKK